MKKAPNPDYDSGDTKEEVGMDERLTQFQVDLYPRYPLRPADVISVVRPEVHMERRPQSRLTNQSLIEDDNQEILHANHPWKPKGRR